MKKTLSILSANSVYLVTMLLVISAGSLLQTLSLSWGLVATEVFLILLPAVLLLRVRGIPLKSGLRLTPIHPRVAGLCVLLGFSIFLFSVLIEGIMAQLTHLQSVPIPTESLPKGMLESLVYFAALAVFAPVCEEVLFRGAIQGAYESQRSPKFAILICGTLFAFYHFRLSGLPALLPVAFILGYVAWRTQSIFASMLVHFGLNATAGANTLYAFQTGRGLPFISLGTDLAGILAAAGLILLLRRWVPAPTPPPPSSTPLPGAEAAPTLTRTWLSSYWPLAPAALLYLLVVSMTLVFQLFPQLAPISKVTYAPPRIMDRIQSHYQVTSRTGDPVGELSCTISPLGPKFRLDCTRTVKAYNANVGDSFFHEEANTAVWSAVWDSKTLDLLEYSFQRSLATGNSMIASVQDGKMVTTTPDGSDQLALPGSALVEFEWPWRIVSLSSHAGAGYKVNFVSLSHWTDALKRGVPEMKDQVMLVTPGKALSLPAGSYSTWKVTVAGQSAWFAQDDAGFPRPVQFDDGMTSYQLVK